MLERIKSWLPGGRQEAEESSTSISGADLMGWLVEGRMVTMLDVRDQKQYRRGHIKGSTLLPQAELQKRTHEVRRDRPVVVVCASGGRAMQSARWLRSQGFEAMYLIGGVNEWPGRLVK